MYEPKTLVHEAQTLIDEPKNLMHEGKTFI